MHKELFDDAIGEVPPSTVDVETAITRGRRAARLRPVANPVVAAGLAVMVVAGAVAVAVTGGDGEATRVGGQPGTPTKAPATTTSTSRAQPAMPPAACSRTDLETSAEVIARLTPVVRAAVSEQRPDLRLPPETPEPLEFSHYYLDDPEAADKPICHKHAGFEATATTNGPEGEGKITVSVGAVYFNPSGFCAEVSGSYCEESTGPDGEVVVTFSSEEEGGVIAERVYVLRQDGTLIMLNAENVAPAGTAPLTLEQLVGIGTDPGLTLFP